MTSSDLPQGDSVPKPLPINAKNMGQTEVPPEEDSEEYKFKKDPPISAKNIDRRVNHSKTKHKRRITDSQWDTWKSRVRDVLFLGVGIWGAGNQLFFATPPNPVVYPIIAALLGAPIAFNLDERRRNNNDDEKEE